MNNKVNPVVIGVFVVSALAIAIVAMTAIGASKFFEKTDSAICYFRDSVNGLEIGAPVKYKGVTIGKVDNILIFPSPRNPRKSLIATKLSIDTTTIKKRAIGAEKVKDQKAQLEKQIQDGLRAKLNFQSIVTGMLYIELDYIDHNKPYTLHNIINDEALTEIPVEESGISDTIKMMEDTLKEVAQIDFKGISENLNTLLKTSNEKIAQLDVENINKNLVQTLENANAIMAQAKNENLPAELKSALAEAKSMLSSSQNTMQAANELMQNANELVENANAIVSPDSPFLYDISIFLKNLSSTANSIKTLADFLDRNPSALLTGRPETSK
ncbi:MAG: MCE family protein [Opitutales bacterium]|nr:MCE family protein [Opitutales bacterium]